jgi:hypothetical protein
MSHTEKNHLKFLNYINWLSGLLIRRSLVRVQVGGPDHHQASKQLGGFYYPYNPLQKNRGPISRYCTRVARTTLYFFRPFVLVYSISFIIQCLSLSNGSELNVEMVHNKFDTPVVYLVKLCQR